MTDAPKGLSAADLALLKRFGGAPDRYGLGVVVIDCGEENLAALLNAARAEAQPPALPAGDWRTAAADLLRAYSAIRKAGRDDVPDNNIEAAMRQALSAPALPADVGEVVAGLSELVAFLDGRDALDGLRFGDAPDAAGRLRFWWRAHLKRIDAALALITAQAGEIAQLGAESAALTKALTGLTCNGSEFFVRKGDRYVADIPACVGYVNRRVETMRGVIVKETGRRQAAEDRIVELTGDLERLRQDAGAPGCEVEAMATELRWIALFADMRSKDDSKVFARVCRGALRTIAERATAAISGKPPAIAGKGE